MARSKARKLAQLLSANNTLSDSEISASEVTGLHDIATTGDYGDLVNVPATFPPHDHTLDSHSNVTITSASASQFLKWNGSAWVNDDIPQINSLDDISDVTITSASTDQFLKWNGSAWVNDDIPQINSVGDISNVTITSAATGDFLRYNGTAWVDSTIQDSDISSSAVTQHLGSYATTSYVDTEVANIVDSAPATLDTLNELAAALGDDPNFATTISNQIGTKLNSSSYTAADVLAKIKTVDGAGSGLDADLLDGTSLVDVKQGIEATALNSTNDLNTITTNGHYRWTSSVPTNAPSGTYHNMMVLNDGGQPTQMVWGGTGSGTADIHIRRRDNGTWRSWTTFWNSGNDGAGSGLDADLLDGIQASSFLRSDAADTATGTITISTGTSQPLVLQTSSGGPWAMGLYRSDTGSNSKVFNNGYWAFEHNPRYYNGGAYSRLLHTGDEGSGNGLDADTVDGIQASSFLRSDTNDTMTGKLTVDNELRIDNGNGTATHINYSNSSVNYIRGTNTIIDSPIDMNNYNIGDVGTLSVNGLIQGQGDVAIGGGSGYGYLKGYTSNWNHFIGSRMQVSGSRSSPTISGGHHCTLVEYLNTEDSGFWFKSSHTSSYSNIAHIGPSYTRIYSGRIKLEGTGRIEGIDTVSSGTDAANKNYVDTQVASSGASMASLYTYI